MCGRDLLVSQPHRGDWIRTSDLLVPNEEVIANNTPMLASILDAIPARVNFTSGVTMRRFSYYAAAFLSWADKCRHPVTVAVYRHYFDRFAAENGDPTIARINPAALSAWAKTWHQSQAIVRLFRWCVEDAELLPRNPVARAKHPPKGERRRIATKREQRRILAAAGVDLRALLSAYLETMARPGELRAATWGDLHPFTTREKLRAALLAGKAQIVLYDYKSRKRRRLPNEPRVILLSPRAGKLLCALMPRVIVKGERIFKTRRGRVWTANALRCRMRRLRAALSLRPDHRGENLVPYTFRHTSATEATAFGIRDRTLADILGHTETATTKRYQHLSTDHLRNALKKFWAR